MNRVSLVSRSHTAAADAADGSAPHRYWAYLSYSHRDEADAKWLHAALEKFTVPPALVGRETANGPIPKSFAPIFRDRQELAASADLGGEIREALAGSRFLIVLCSPAAAASHWTDEEIATFKRLHPDKRILAAIVAGEPWASLMPGREAEECFPPALRVQFDRRGRPTKKRAEPIAADLREGRDGRRMGMLKIAAGMLGVGLDDLVQREAQRRQKRLTYIAAASLAGMTLTSGLAVFAFDKRDEARDQRREAEGLVGFMVGDMREKLEPIGRLDALDAVGARALQYFGKQDKSELSDAALAQRSRALTLLGEIAMQRGDLNGAMARYREAMSGTAEMMRRTPNDPQRLFDHAQNVFWIGDIALKRGQLDRAEAAMREYMRLADAMVALDPGNRKWRMETKYADNNLGALLHEQRRYREAAQQLERALSTVETLAAAEPGNQEYQESVPESLAWLADAQFGEGRLDEAIAKRERQVALLEDLSRYRRSDVDYRQRQIPARRALGRMLATQGAIGAGLEQVRAAVKIGQELIPTDPDNMQWLRYTAGAQLDMSKILLVARNVDEAAVQTRAGCDLTNRLAQRDKNNIESLSLVIVCLDQRSRVALEKGAHDEALALAGQALRAAQSTRGGDPADYRMRIAGAHKLVGDINYRLGNRSAAQTSWQAALAVWPRIAENPREMAIRAAILKDAGRAAEAKALSDRLNAIGYRRLI